MKERILFYLFLVAFAGGNFINAISPQLFNLLSLKTQRWLRLTPPVLIPLPC
jgi:hypothetical protein